MTTPHLDRLSTVDPRTVWPHEAHAFTPWLLNNVDVLSDLLGMDLVLDVAEHPVGASRSTYTAATFPMTASSSLRTS